MGSKASRQERQARLRPMGSVEVVTVAFEVCQQSAIVAFKASAGPVIAALATLLFIVEVAVPVALFTPHNRPVDPFAPLLAVGAAGIVCVVIAAWVYSSVMDTVLPIAARHLTGEAPPARRGSFGTALLVSSLLLGPFFGGLFLIFLSDIAFVGKQGVQASIGVYGFLLIAFGGLAWLFGLQALSLSPVAALVEGAGPFRSLVRGFALGKRTRGNTGSPMTLMGVFLLVLAVTGLSGALLLFALIPGEALAATPLGTKGSELLALSVSLLPFLAATMAVPPLWASCAVVTYYSRRIAVEGYDIEVVAREMGMLHDKG